MKKKNEIPHNTLVEVYSHCKGWHLALSSGRERQTDKTNQAPKYKAINCYGSVEKRIIYIYKYIYYAAGNYTST